MSSQIVPIPRVPVSVRVAMITDLPFMDELQKKNGRALGYFPRKQFEDYIGQGAVLIAEDPHPSPLPEYREGEKRLGYCIAKDRYLKRDELGVVYQLCVVPGVQRQLVGASLVKAVFERAAYGCRLFCCWCAQDLAANYFWESLGFVPLAFRAGSDRKRRVHIFWQRRIDADHDATPYWYPFKTDQGALREDRLVFPIPPGMHWSEVRAVVMPEASKDEVRRLKDEGSAKALPAPRKKRSSFIPHPSSLPHKVGILVGGRIKYVDRPGYAAPVLVPSAGPETVKKIRAPKPPAEKIDPTLLAKVRELRDRWMERANLGGFALSRQGKYDVSRTLGAAESARALPAPRGGERRPGLPEAA